MSFYQQTLQRIQTGKGLLETPKRKNRLFDIKQLLRIPDQTTYEAICLPVLEQIAELSQQLARTDLPRFQESGGHLDYLLERCAAVLRLLEDQLQSSDAADYILANPELWRYTLFTVVLLQHIGEFVSHYTITLFSELKENKGIFSPFLGTMSHYGSFYSMRYHSQGDSDIRDKATLLLAQQIMPKAGLIWISKNEIAFAFWLKVLTGNLIERDSRRLSGPRQLLTEALARILNRSLPAERLNKPKSGFLEDNPLHTDPEIEKIKKAEHSLTTLLMDSYETDNTSAAKAFLDDLRERLDFSEIAEGNLTDTNTRTDRITVNSEKETYPVYLIKDDKGETLLFIGEKLIQESAKKNGITTRELIKQLSLINALAISPGSQTGGLHYLALQSPEGARALGGLSVRNLGSLFPALGPNTPRLAPIPSNMIPSAWPKPISDLGPTPTEQQATQTAENAKIISITQPFFK